MRRDSSPSSIGSYEGTYRLAERFAGGSANDATRLAYSVHNESDARSYIIPSNDCWKARVRGLRGSDDRTDIAHGHAIATSERLEQQQPNFSP